MSQVQLSMRGTPGYLAPEWHQALGRITVRVDVHSFGIVLLEVVCERKSVDLSQPESAFHLLRMLQNKAEYILEFSDEHMQSDGDEIIRMIKIAAWCLQDDPEKKPLMSTVVKVCTCTGTVAPPPVVDDYIVSAPAPVFSNPR
ncbi:hypothetical protein OIU74_002966 [Salix koriyanagi]|uniref:Protein kinase domain-containing protein n=1 Tax=Salix koriyanagi TaxID=2511006 RepID=A0A9Q0UWT0_9ROSI|nr:hypothetical protein OIU74_002966 [Salix koriyanagi]